MNIKPHFGAFRYLLTLPLLSGGRLLAQSATPTASATHHWELSTIMGVVLLVAVAVIFVAALAVIVRANNILYRNVLRNQAAAQGITLETPAPEALETGGDFWRRMRQKYWENAVPREREHEIMLAHGFDGIHELDNNLPPWWLNMFYLTILWAAGYMVYYHWGGNGPSSADEYQEEVAVAKKQIALALSGKAEQVNEENVKALDEPPALADGELIYKANCAACHGQAGEGGVGPNLCDPNWVHGGGIKNVFKTIKYGVPEKGMIAWSATLKPSDIQKVASYILHFQGTTPANAKAPQGEIWAEPAPADSTATSGQ